MKKILILLLFSIISNLFAQASFYKGTYQEALQYAHSQNKNVILLFGNEYCKPCLKLKKDFFDSEEIGDFLNNHFIIKEVTARVKSIDNKLIYEDTPDGELSKKFNVAGFPHIEIINPESISNPVKVVSLRGLDLREFKDGEYTGTGFPATFFKERLNDNSTQDTFEFKLETIKAMLAKYIKN